MSSKIDLTKEKLAMRIVCGAISKNHELIDKMKVNEDHTWDIEFKVGGVEIDFMNFAKDISEVFDEAITKRAKELLDKKFNNMFNVISEIQDKLDYQNDNLKYDWENDK